MEADGAMKNQSSNPMTKCNGECTFCFQGAPELPLVKIISLQIRPEDSLPMTSFSVCAPNGFCGGWVADWWDWVADLSVWC